MRGRTVNGTVTRGHRRKRAGRTAAFSFIELVVAMALLAMILLGFAATSSVAARNRELSEQQRRAEQALSAWLAELREVPLTDLATVAATARTTPVDGLTNVTWTLTVFDDEDAAVPALAFPIDLNGDGDATDQNVPAAGAVLVPARLTISWTNPAIDSDLEVTLYAYFSAL